MSEESENQSNQDDAENVVVFEGHTAVKGPSWFQEDDNAD